MPMCIFPDRPKVDEYVGVLHLARGAGHCLPALRKGILDVVVNCLRTEPMME